MSDEIDDLTGRALQIIEDSDFDQYSYEVLFNELGSSLLFPEKVSEQLDELVVSQEEAKKVLSIGVFTSQLRYLYGIQNDGDAPPFKKSNILLCGPTGVGKTHLIQMLGEVLEVPVLIVDITSFTATGYMGRSAAEIMQEYCSAVGEFVLDNYEITDEEEFQVLFYWKYSTGIIYIDEIDKIRKVERRGTQDIGGGEVQAHLLKIIEGVDFSAKILAIEQAGKEKEGEREVKYALNSGDVLFVFGGAFTGIEDIINQRLSISSIGFTKDTVNKKYADPYSLLTLKDLTSYGLIPELLGRIPEVVVLNRLTLDHLFQILKIGDRSVFNSYVKLFKMYEVEFEITDEALMLIATEALKLKTGARALDSLCAKVLREAQFRAPSNPNIKKITINRDYVVKQLNIDL